MTRGGGTKVACMPPPIAPQACIGVMVGEDCLEMEVDRLNAENDMLKKKLFDSQDEVSVSDILRSVHCTCIPVNFT